MSEPISENTTSRIINFTDAIVAIAATLLILQPIDAAADTGMGQSVPEVLSANADQLLGFAVSFVVIGHFWLLHRRLFRMVKEFTQLLYWFNLLWLFSIVFLPYPTALLAGRTDDPGTCALYIGTMAVTSLTALVLKILVPLNESEQLVGLRGSRHIASAIAAVVALTAATVLALVVPWMHLWGLLLLVPTVFMGRFHRRSEKTTPLSVAELQRRARSLGSTYVDAPVVLRPENSGRGARHVTVPEPPVVGQTLAGGAPGQDQVAR